jgi:hypothetical protein
VALLDHLALAEKHILEGERHVKRQREILQDLQRDGRDALKAKDLLRSDERAMSLHSENRDRIRGELSVAGAAA